MGKTIIQRKYFLIIITLSFALFLISTLQISAQNQPVTDSDLEPKNPIPLYFYDIFTVKDQTVYKELYDLEFFQILVNNDTMIMQGVGEVQLHADVKIIDLQRHSNLLFVFYVSDYHSDDDLLGFEIYNITYTLSPEFISSFNFTNNDEIYYEHYNSFYESVHITDDYIYIRFRDKNTDLTQISIIDYQNASNPTFCSSINYPDGNVGDFCVRGNSIVYARRTNNDAIYDIFDISNKTNPTIIGSFDTVEIPNKSYINGDYLYFTRSFYTIDIYSLFNTTTPIYYNSKLIELVNCSIVDLLFNDNDEMFVLTYDSVELYNCENGSDLQYIGGIILASSTPGTTYFGVNDNYILYLARTSEYQDYTLVILDFTDPQNIILLYPEPFTPTINFYPSIVI
ncbi:MAG: hypothetical protein FK734_03160, partial [Asgard group archaeon]|nr:hypothetical protein [Asgard group archaeon]